MKIVLTILVIFLISSNVFGYDKYPKQYSEFKCIAKIYDSKSEFYIHSCNYEKNTCKVTPKDINSEGEVDAYAKLWDINDSRLTLIVDWKISYLRILTIYPDYSKNGIMPLSLVLQSFNEPKLLENTNERKIIDGAMQFIGNCIPIK